MEVAWLGQLSGCAGGRCHSNSIDTCKRKCVKMVFRISNFFLFFFNQEAHDPNHSFIKSLGLGVRSSRAVTCIFT